MGGMLSNIHSAALTVAGRPNIGGVSVTVLGTQAVVTTGGWEMARFMTCQCLRADAGSSKSEGATNTGPDGSASSLVALDSAELGVEGSLAAVAGDRK